MPAANRGVPKPASVSAFSESSEISGATLPMEVEEAMEITSPTPQQYEQSRNPINVTTFTQMIDPYGKTVAMSIAQPRLTANGKRIGRPPGTFKVQKVKKEPIQEKIIFDTPKVCEWDNCNQEFLSVQDIVNHMYREHYKPKEVVCKWEGCNNRKFKSYYMLIGHCRTHTGERPNKCPLIQCAKTYKSKENLTTHMRTHTGEKPYNCQFPKCLKRFNNASDRGKHENRCHSDKKHYICDIDKCMKSYTDPSSLRKHILHVHGREAQKRRKNVRVRWTYRRDGRKVNEDGTVSPVDRTLQSAQRMGSKMQVASQIGQTSTPITENPANLSMSAFHSYVPKAFHTNLYMLGYLNFWRVQSMAFLLAQRQEFIEQSYQNLHKPAPLQPKAEYVPCKCKDCQLQALQVCVDSYREFKEAN